MVCGLYLAPALLRRGFSLMQKIAGCGSSFHGKAAVILNWPTCLRDIAHSQRHGPDVLPRPAMPPTAPGFFFVGKLRPRHH
jgi:hypothetical protein